MYFPSGPTVANFTPTVWSQMGGAESDPTPTQVSMRFTACKAGPSGISWWVCMVKAMVLPVVTYGCEKVKVSQSHLTLCDLMDYTVHGILQARILEWVAFLFSRGSQPRDGTQVSHIASRFFISWATREAHGCESWTIKKAEHWRIDAFRLWCWRRLLRLPWTARSNQSILKEISPEYSLKGPMLKLKL